MIRLSPAERAQVAVGRRLLSLPDGLLGRLLGPPVVRDGHTLDRQLQLALAIDARLHKGLARGDIPLERGRRDLEVRAAVLSPSPPPLRSVTDLLLDLGGGSPPVRARRYKPFGVGDRAAPALVYLHGGGWVQGSLDSHDALCAELAARTPCVVFAIDYRLAPEHRFPAALQDALAALRAVHGQAAALGVDPARIAIGGDSAGGNLSAVVSQQTRGEAARPCFQLLVYPATDLTMSMPSIESLGHGFFLERDAMEWFRAQYLPAGTDARDQARLKDPRLSPCHEEDLSGLPPAFVITAGFDPLRDEGEAYARRMREAGAEVRYACYGPMVHGFLNTTGVIRGARPALEDAIEELRRALR